MLPAPSGISPFTCTFCKIDLSGDCVRVQNDECKAHWFHPTCMEKATGKTIFFCPLCAKPGTGLIMGSAKLQWVVIEKELLGQEQPESSLPLPSIIGPEQDQNLPSTSSNSMDFVLTPMAPKSSISKFRKRIQFNEGEAQVEDIQLTTPTKPSTPTSKSQSASSTSTFYSADERSPERINPNSQSNQVENGSSFSRRLSFAPKSASREGSSAMSSSGLSGGPKSTGSPKSKLPKKESQTFKCKKCQKTFARSTYYRHLRKPPCGGKNLESAKCPKCGKVFSRKDSLATHLKAKHSIPNQ